MANFIYSRVTIEPEEAMDKICDMIESMSRADYGKETKVIVESFYTEEEIKSTYGNGQTEYPITEDGVNHSWLYDHVGSKWLTVGIDDDIRIESAGSTPDGFLIKLYNICSNEFENVVVTRTFSKGFGVPSIRLGYLISNEANMSVLTKTRLAHESNSLTNAVAEYLIDNYENVVKVYNDRVIASRDALKKTLHALDISTHGNNGNYLLLDL